MSRPFAKPHLLAVGLVLSALAPLASAPAAQACTCVSGIPLASNFEDARWVVLARVDSVKTVGGTTSMTLTVEERFKGPETSFRFKEHRRLSPAACHLTPRKGERWLLFLHPRDSFGTGSRPARWPTQCVGSRRLGPHPELAAADAEALATVRALAAGSAPPG